MAEPETEVDVDQAFGPEKGLASTGADSNLTLVIEPLETLVVEEGLDFAQAMAALVAQDSASTLPVKRARHCDEAMAWLEGGLVPCRRRP